MRLTDCTISLTGDGVVDFSSADSQRQNGAVNGRVWTALKFHVSSFSSSCDISCLLKPLIKSKKYYLTINS